MFLTVNYVSFKLNALFSYQQIVHIKTLFVEKVAHKAKPLQWHNLYVVIRENIFLVHMYDTPICYEYVNHATISCSYIMDPFNL